MKEIPRFHELNQVPPSRLLICEGLGQSCCLLTVLFSMHMPKFFLALLQMKDLEENQVNHLLASSTSY